MESVPVRLGVLDKGLSEDESQGPHDLEEAGTEDRDLKEGNLVGGWELCGEGAPSAGTVWEPISDAGGLLPHVSRK